MHELDACTSIADLLLPSDECITVFLNTSWRPVPGPFKKVAPNLSQQQRHRLTPQSIGSSARYVPILASVLSMRSPATAQALVLSACLEPVTDPSA